MQEAPICVSEPSVSVVCVCVCVYRGNEDVMDGIVWRDSSFVGCWSTFRCMCRADASIVRVEFKRGPRLKRIKRHLCGYIITHTHTHTSRASGKHKRALKPVSNETHSSLCIVPSWFISQSMLRNTFISLSVMSQKTCNKILHTGFFYLRKIECIFCSVFYGFYYCKSVWCWSKLVFWW